MTRVAVVGAGYFGRFHHDAWSETEAAAYPRNLEIEEAVCRSHEERRWIDV